MANEKILIAEDDDGLRQLATRILTKAGYQVFSAARYDQAEEIALEHGSSIHLLLTDVVMPEVSGKELADRLTAKYPQMVVLYMSGYTDEVVLTKGVRKGTMHFIAKPFTPASLAQKVREVLDAEACRHDP